MRTALATRPPFDPTVRGYQPVYRRHEANFCPGCGRTSWFIGRITAECAFCKTAIPLEDAKR